MVTGDDERIAFALHLGPQLFGYVQGRLAVVAGGVAVEPRGAGAERGQDNGALRETLGGGQPHHVALQGNVLLFPKVKDGVLAGGGAGFAARRQVDEGRPVLRDGFDAGLRAGLAHGESLQPPRREVRVERENPPAVFRIFRHRDDFHEVRSLLEGLFCNLAEGRLLGRTAEIMIGKDNLAVLVQRQRNEPAACRFGEREADVHIVRPGEDGQREPLHRHRFVKRGGVHVGGHQFDFAFAGEEFLELLLLPVARLQPDLHDILHEALR